MQSIRCGLLLSMLHALSLSLSLCVCVCQSVCVSVCLSFGHNREPCKNGLNRRDVVLVVDSGGSRNNVLGRGPGPQGRKLFGGGISHPPHCKVKEENMLSCRETADQIVVWFGMKTHMEPRADGLM